MWDDAIDDVARDLTAGSPGGDFRARVLLTIDAAAVGPHEWKWRIPALTVLATTALIALAAYIGTHQPRPASGTTVAVSNHVPAPRPIVAREPTGAATTPRPRIMGARPSRPSRAIDGQVVMPPLEFAAAMAPIAPAVIDAGRIAINALPRPDLIVVDEVSVPVLVVRAFDAPVEDNP